MRRILIDNARRKKAQRHGGGWARIECDGLDLAAGMADDQLLADSRGARPLAAHDALKAELVKLRFFAGLTLEESAKVLDLSLATAKRHWAYARAWLYREIKAAPAVTNHSCRRPCPTPLCAGKSLRRYEVLPR